jgi:hypothetical protein
MKLFKADAVGLAEEMHSDCWRVNWCWSLIRCRCTLRLVIFT